MANELDEHTDFSSAYFQECCAFEYCDHSVGSSQKQVAFRNSVLSLCFSQPHRASGYSTPFEAKIVEYPCNIYYTKN